MTLAHPHDLGCLGDGKLVFQNTVENLYPCLFLLIQRYILHKDDIFADQLAGDRIVEHQQGLHHAGVEFRSLAEDFDTATSTGKLQLSIVLAFSEWWRNSIRERTVAGQAKARTEGRFPGRTAQPDRAAAGVHPGRAIEGSEPAGTGQAPGGQPLDNPAGGRVGVGWNIAASARSMSRWSDASQARTASS